jgi:hypothetical protein
MKRIVVSSMAVLGLIVVWTPIRTLLYQGFHGRITNVDNYQVKVPRWYVPMDSKDASTSDVWFSAGASVLSSVRVINVAKHSPGTEAYEAIRKMSQQAFQVSSVSNEQTIQTPAGLSQCFEIALTKDRVEARCQWDTAPLLVTYVGPSKYKSDMYELARTAELQRN